MTLGREIVGSRVWARVRPDWAVAEDQMRESVPRRLLLPQQV